MSRPGVQQVRVDAVIVGGGIAGLWLLNRLTDSGFQTMLLERNGLGSGQTINSQGIIHGGLKYALSGALTSESEAIRGMPGRWRRCLAGTGEIDLSRVEVLSDSMLLWTTAGLGASIKGLFAQKAARSRVERIRREHLPEPFSHPAYRGDVYRFDEPVLNVPSLVSVLSGRCRDRIFRVDQQGPELVKDERGQVASLIVRSEAAAYEFAFSVLIFAAGEGNEALLRAAGAPGPAMQRRPLQQVLVRHDYPHPLYGHCIGAGLSASPRITVTSHRSSDSRWVWYLGGDIATSHVDAPADRLIGIAKKELSETLGWIDLGRTEWATFRVDRAEPRQDSLLKPDRPFAAFADGTKRLAAAWPTKLAFAPMLADEVLALINGAGHRPSGVVPIGLSLPFPGIAAACWETLLP